MGYLQNKNKPQLDKYVPTAEELAVKPWPSESTLQQRKALVQHAGLWGVGISKKVVKTTILIPFVKI